MEFSSMLIEQTSQLIKQAGLIAILRGGFTVDDMIRIGEALRLGGVTTMEVTLNSTNALEALPKLREYFGTSMLVGAGTVRDVLQTRQALESGAQFIVSPNFDLDSVTYSLTHDMLHLPGVFTATEAQIAFTAGCRMLKLFPSDTVGPAYLKALRAPLNDVEFVPTGGISLDNIAAYARAGAVAVGMGSQLVSSQDQSSSDLTANAKALLNAWQEAKRA
jgi:2-dehydro-3-deoxyphosphogluconate aldolase / (4S)-4-hydroxy-2-oxoglutarate aldolase